MAENASAVQSWVALHFCCGAAHPTILPTSPQCHATHRFGPPATMMATVLRAQAVPGVPHPVISASRTRDPRR
jgi:hypothetical protein